MYNIHVIILLTILSIHVDTYTCEIDATSTSHYNSDHSVNSTGTIICTYIPYCILGGLYYNSTHGASCPGGTIPSYVIPAECFTIMQQFISAYVLTTNISISGISTYLAATIRSHNIDINNMLLHFNNTLKVLDVQQQSTNQQVIMINSNNVNNNDKLIYYSIMLLLPLTGVTFICLAGIIIYIFIISRLHRQKRLRKCGLLTNADNRATERIASGDQ
jgi:hypothetical protein